MMLSRDSPSRSSPFSKDDIEQGRGPEDGQSRDGSGESSEGKRKFTHREPESPDQIDNDIDSAPASKKEKAFFQDIDADSPASYPKHVLVPTSDRPADDKTYPPHTTQLADEERAQQPAFPPESEDHGAPVLTPDSAGRGGGRPGPNYDMQAYSRNQHYHDVYRAPSYTPDMDYGRTYGGGHAHHTSAGPPPPGGEGYHSARRWACDYCNVATFLSYEEACAHEEACARRHHDTAHYPDSYHRPRHPSSAAYAHRGPPPPQGSGLGALYHASQEVVTPPTPHHHQPPPSRWGNHAPPLPVLPHEQGYYRQGYYDMREEPAPYHHDPHYYNPPPPQFPHQQPMPYQHHPHHPPQDYYQKRMLLSMPSDRDSLSDRQCYVRSEMVEIFAATQKDVSARHSKGAQKLVMGQVGIRCIHCSHLRPRDRAERAVCYPSSISRIYQTVADMQRFHFEQCREIPDQARQLYKKLKTTRPRGVGSPQTYWVSSAKALGLVDTESGIRFENDMGKDEHSQLRHSSDMSTSTSK